MGVTTLDTPAVEAFAAWIRQLYLYADWDNMAQLIRYPSTLYPNTVINDADAFRAFMANKVMTESDTGRNDRTITPPSYCYVILSPAKKQGHTDPEKRAT